MNWRTTGALKFLDELRAEFPSAILELFSVPGLGAKKIKALYEQLKVSSIADLQAACESGRVAALPGFGETTQTKICNAIANRAKHSGSFQFGEIAAEAEQLRSDLAAHNDALQVSVAGSFRRRKEIVRDLDFIVASKSPDAITEFFCAHPLVEGLIARGPTKTSVRLKSGIQCDLRVVTNAEYPFALNYFTGSKEHNIVMRNRALNRGWTLNEYRLGPAPIVETKLKTDRAGSPESPTRKSGRGRSKSIAPAIPKINEEAELYRALGLDFIPPELRENCGEFEAAAIRKIAALDRAGEFARHLSLPYHRQRRAQFARGNGRSRAGTWPRISWHRRPQPQLGPGARTRCGAAESAASADSKIAKHDCLTIPDFQRNRMRHSARRFARFRGRNFGASSITSSRRCIRLSI